MRTVFYTLGWTSRVAVAIGSRSGKPPGVHLHQYGGPLQVTYHEELAERDVREDVVRLVLPAQLLGLLPVVREFLGEGAHRSQVQDIFPRQRVVQEGIVDM